MKLSITLMVSANIYHVVTLINSFMKNLNNVNSAV